MEKIIAHSSIGSDKKDSLIYRVSEEAISNEGKKIRNLIQKFKAFCERQQENRLGWTALTIGGQVFLLVPITLMVVTINRNRFTLWIPVILSSFVAAVSNLTALPTKITILLFCASVLINLGVIVLSFVQ